MEMEPCELIGFNVGGTGRRERDGRITHGAILASCGQVPIAGCHGGGRKRQSLHSLTLHAQESVVLFMTPCYSDRQSYQWGCMLPPFVMHLSA